MKTTFVERERLSGIAYIETLAATVRATWAACCRADDIAEDSLFVVFSETNPIAPFYDRAVVQLREARAAFMVMGYCGLSPATRELFKPKRAHASRAREGVAVGGSENDLRMDG